MAPTLTFTDNRVKGSYYPALILIEHLAGNTEVLPVNVEHHAGDLIVKGNNDSSVSLKIDGQDIIYGGKAVFKGILNATGAVSVDEKEVNYWIDFAFDRLTVKEFGPLSAAIAEVDDHLVLRTFFVRYGLSVADIAVWGALKGSPQAAGILKKGGLVNLERWFKVLEAQPAVVKAAELLQEKKKAKSSVSNYEIGLPDVEKGVVTRFPPEPSGYLHIGHAKAAMLNDYFARLYNGKLIIRFDDTNPSKEKQEFEDSILQDLVRLGIKGDIFSYTSDYFQAIYELAIKMIKEGKAYCDDTDVATMRLERGDGIASRRRERSVEENLHFFEEMKNGTEEGLKNCLRAKLSVDDNNKALRDPVIYRCNPATHHRTGNQWKIYPTYDFACPIVDSIEGVTHALRTTEYRDRNAQYAWMQEALGIRKVHIWDFSRVNFIRTLLSKRKLTWFVETGKVRGWDDPRFPTVRGILRRGMTVEALRQFIISQGPSKNVVNMEWGVVWAVNKKVIDPVAPRYTAIPELNAVKAKVIGGPSPAVIEQKLLHKKNPAVGNKAVYFSDEVLIAQDDAASFAQDEEVTLMDWGNVFVRKIVKDGDIVTALELELHLAGDFKKTDKKVTWLSTAQSLTPVELHFFDHLITKDKLEENDSIEDCINPNSETVTKALADENIKTLKADTIIQFERIGYFRTDVSYDENQPAVFFDIPTGRK